MKKLVYSAIALAVSVLSLTSCEDVPAPYTLPTDSENTEIKVAPKGTGTETDPYNVAAVLKLYENNSYDANKEVYVKGIVAKVGSIDTGNYGNATYYISDDGTSTNDFEIYRGKYLNGDKFTSTDQLKVGQTVVVCGKLTLYNTTKEMAQGSKLISIEGEGTSTESGSEETTTNGISISGTTVSLINKAVTEGTTSVTIDLSTLGLTNGSVISSTITMPDEATVTFDKGTNSNAPTYYDKTKGVRVYANNTITITGKSTIAKVVFTCDSNSGTDYVGNTTATVTFNGNTAVYTNASENAGTQLRVQTITIYYAN